MRSLCPVCGRAGCTAHLRSVQRRKRKPRTGEQEQTRKDKEPWRSKYRDKGYQRARQRAIRRYAGKCAICGCQAFRRNSAGAWVQLLPGAGVHHVRKLSQGGEAVQEDMIPVCAPCHAQLDREGGRGRRKGDQQ